MLIEVRVIVSDEEPNAKRIMNSMGWETSRDGNETVFRSHKFMVVETEKDKAEEAAIMDELKKRLIW